MATVKDALASLGKNIEASTGKPMSAWITLSRSSGFEKHGEIVKWLKAHHGLGHGYANHIAKMALQADETADDDLVDAQYSGAKASLKPLYDQLVALVRSFGHDVEIAPKKHNVSIRRTKQFALLQASTVTRLDVGVILKDLKPAGRLEASGSFNAMFTHRIRVTSKKDIDAQLKSWLRQAYDSA